MMTCTVRKLEANDAEAWAALRLQALEAHPLAFGSTVPDDPEVLVESIRSRLAAKESAVFGAFTGEALIGMVGVLRDKGQKERHKAWILGMYVSAENRRSGVGGKLLRQAIQEARSWKGVVQVHLAVSEVADEARRLYEKFGFREWGREPRALCWEGRYADETHMVLDLLPRQSAQEFLADSR